jgi:hypothetical protein
MSGSPTWDFGQVAGCDPGIQVFVEGVLIDSFDLNPTTIFPDDYLKIIGPPDQFARFVTWIFDPDPDALEILNTAGFPLSGGTRGLAGELIPLAGP